MSDEPILCRTCCEPPPPNVDNPFISVVTKSDRTGIPIAEMIYHITDIMVTLDPLLSQQICPVCMIALNNAHRFREQAINSNTVLLGRRLPRLPEPNEDCDMLTVKDEFIDPDLEAEESNLYRVTDEEPVMPKPKKIRKTPRKSNSNRTNRRRSFREIVLNECLEQVGDTFICVADRNSMCTYTGDLTMDRGNFIKHCRMRHRKVAIEKGLFKEKDIVALKSVKELPVTINPTNTQPRKKKKQSFRTIAKKCMKLVNGQFVCTIDSTKECAYWQINLDMGNYIRHFREMHKPIAKALGLFKHKKGDQEQSETKPVVKKVPKTPKLAPVVRLRDELQYDGQFLIKNSIKLVALHMLPVECFDWDGFRSLFNVLAKPLDMEVTSSVVTSALKVMAEKMVMDLRVEMQHKLVSILIDSAVLHDRQYLTLSAQYVYDCLIRTRFLGVIQVKPNDTIKILESRIISILRRYELDVSQIYSIVVENGSKELVSKTKLSKAFAQTLRFRIDIEASGIMEVDELLESLSAGLREQFNVVRGPLRDLNYALNDILSGTDPSLIRINKFVQDLSQFKRQIANSTLCLSMNATSHRWTVKYKIIEIIYKEQKFLTQLVQDHPELDFGDQDWRAVANILDAFRPVYILVERLADTKNHIFSEFYMQWLMVIRELRRNQQLSTENRFLKPLVESMTRRVAELRQNMAFKAGMLLDPRFNYIESVVFSGQQRDEMKNYILNIWNRINALKPNSQTAQFEADKLKQEDKKDDDMDDFLSEMFGGPSEGTSKAVVPLSSTVTPVLQQLKSLEIEPRQPHDYDVWNHWLQRSVSHAELFSVAMVVMSLPSNNVCLERTYSALILADRNDGLTEQTLDELLLVKLNSSLFEKAVVTMYDWKNITRPQETE
ncbi:uncharacterized protein LOC134205795 isoform X3 [Armigeres subalbatus]|uniref:uncharacterized protein LOC134205795 isoform X3 n=1 Tax=Armigeres subalbatus TaxID=124917 RepID=UPI002ED218C2